MSTAAFSGIDPAGRLLTISGIDISVEYKGSACGGLAVNVVEGWIRGRMEGGAGWVIALVRRVVLWAPDKRWRDLCLCEALGEADAVFDVVGVYGLEVDVEGGQEAGGGDAVAVGRSHDRRGRRCAG